MADSYLAFFPKLRCTLSLKTTSSKALRRVFNSNKRRFCVRPVKEFRACSLRVFCHYQVHGSAMDPLFWGPSQLPWQWRSGLVAAGHSLGCAFGALQSASSKSNIGSRTSTSRAVSASIWNLRQALGVLLAGLEVRPLLAWRHLYLWAPRSHGDDNAERT